MRSVLALLVAALLAGCSANAPNVIDSRAQVARKERSTSEGLLAIQGMAGLDSALLEIWQGHVTVTQAPAAGEDQMEVAFGAGDSTGTMSGGMWLTKQVSPPMQVEGEYQLASPEVRGDRNQVNLTRGNEEYTSVAGKVIVSYERGKISGTFDAQVVPVDDWNAEPTAVQGTFEGRMGFHCEVLTTDPDLMPLPGAEGGNIDDPGTPAGPSWISSRLEHPFCRKYL